MITARVVFESDSGHMIVRTALAAPENFREFLAMLFRDKYRTSRHNQTDSWYPVFQKQMSATHSPELQEQIEKQKFQRIETRPVLLNGKPYDNE